MTMNTHSPGYLSRALATAMSRRAALRRVGLVGATMGVLAAVGTDHGEAEEEGPPEAWFAPDASLGSHGMVIVGEGPIYLSHLPMFMFDSPESHPHHYQVIVEGSFDETGHDAYIADRRESEAPLYTLWPQDEYRMLDLILPELSASPVQSLTGKIVRGHWERGSEPQPFGIIWDVVREDVPVKVERVVYAHEFSFQPGSPEQLEYVLFGADDALFLAHRITAAPDFDQILPVTMASGEFGDDHLQAGIVVAIAERENTVEDRLMTGDQVVGTARLAGTGVAVAPRDAETGAAIEEGLQLEAGRELFFEEGELRIPFDMDPTETEIEAGFGFP